MWMSDKPVVQRELAEKISQLIHTHSSSENAIMFIKVFYSTMDREFTKIDRLRYVNNRRGEKTEEMRGVSVHIILGMINF